MIEEKNIGLINFEKHGESLVIKYTSETEIAYDECACCGKPVAKTWYSVNAADGLEYLYGAGCYRKLKKV